MYNTIHEALKINKNERIMTLNIRVEVPQKLKDVQEKTEYKKTTCCMQN